MTTNGSIPTPGSEATRPQVVDSSGAAAPEGATERAVTAFASTTIQLKAALSEVVKSYDDRVSAAAPRHPGSDFSTAPLVSAFNAFRDQGLVLVAEHFPTLAATTAKAIDEIGAQIREIRSFMESPTSIVFRPGTPIAYLQRLGGKRHIATSSIGEFEQRFIHRFRAEVRDKRRTAATTATTDTAAARYEFKGKLGDGRYADVFRAADRQLQREVAIKIIKPEGRESADALEQARALARVRHRNVATVHSVEEVRHPETGESVQGVVMELINGPHLDALMAAQSISVETARAIGFGIIGGLRAIHDAGLVHFDLHEENVLVDSGEARIIDIHYLSTLNSISTRPRQARFRHDFNSLFNLLTRLLRAAGRSARPVNDLADGEVFDLDRARAAFEKALVSADMEAPPVGEATLRSRERMKSILLDPQRQIELYDLVSEQIDGAFAELNSDQFSGSGPMDATALARLPAYETIVHELIGTMILFGRWGEERHCRETVRIVRRLAETTELGNGYSGLLALRWMPLLTLVYAGGISAIAGENYFALAALLNSRVRRREGRDPKPLSEPFSDVEGDIAGVLRLSPDFKGKYTPVSEYLFGFVESHVQAALRLGSLWEDVFDRFEIMHALFHVDANKTYPIIGRFGWKMRNRHLGGSAWADLGREASAAGPSWAPLKAGLFGGSIERFEKSRQELEAFVAKLGWR